MVPGPTGSKWFPVLLFLCISVPRPCESKIIQGHLRTSENWVFLTRFCFLSEVGKFEYDVEYPKEYKTQSLQLYYDEKDQWPAVYGKNLTCEQKESVLSIDKGQVIFLNETTFGSGCFDSRNGSLHCQHKRNFRSARERWWFIALGNCKSNKGLRLDYRISMTNHEYDMWFMHFSADEMYILQTDIGFLVLYVVLLVASLFEAHALRSRHLLHRTYVLYITSVIFECVGLSFLCASYAIYAQEGVVSPRIKLTGKGLEAISTLLLLTLLLLIAKGYTVTRGRLRKGTILKMAAFLSVYLIVYTSLFLYEQEFFDPGKVLYIYESPAGYGIIGLRIVGWSWFVYATIFTLIHYPEKSNFYTRLFLLYSLWFLSAPVVILISTFIVPKWMREKLLNGVELFISLKAHFIFFILTRPATANKNFPFHVRTTQIDIMRENSAEGQSLDHFAHHPYAVKTSHTAPVTDYASLFGINTTATATNTSLSTMNNRTEARKSSRRGNASQAVIVVATTAAATEDS